MMMRSGRALTGGFVLAAGLLLVGCGASGLETGAGTVEEKTAEAFLTTTESDWHRQVDAEPTKNLGPEARCYFVTGADGNKSLGTVACGPLRRLGTAERRVWDIVRIEPTGADKPGVEIPDQEPWKQSQLRPDSSAFWRPDDKQTADDADALAAPSAPPAPTGLTVVSDKSESLELKPARDRLVLPDGTVTLKGLATPETIGSGTEVQAPATGEKFVAAVFGTDPTVDQLTGDPAYNPQKRTPGSKAVETKWTVTVGGQQRPVDVLPGADGSEVTPERTIIVSVPQDATEVLLTATNGGVSQSLSLVSGKRTSTTAAAYYRTGTHAQLNKVLPTKTVNQGSSFKSSFSLSLQQAALTPWDPQAGWAPAGQAWVLVKLDSTLDYPFILYNKAWAPTLLTATADGVPVSKPVGANDPGADVIAFAVPATTKTVEIKAVARLNFTSNSFSRNNTPRSGTAVYPALIATATFQ